jgi:Amt family ammonium transporter
VGYVEGLDMGGQFVIQLIGVGAVLLWTVGASYLIVKVVQAVAGLRVSEDVEVQGIDLRTHGERAYNM